MQKFPTYVVFIGTLALASGVSSCKKFIQVSAPTTSTNAANVYASDGTAAAVLTGVYAKMSNQSYQQANSDITGISIFGGLSADELTLFAPSDANFSVYYTNTLSSVTTNVMFWNGLYQYIFVANSAIEGLAASTALTPAVKNQLLGESEFLRAFCYFYLVGLYGDVPLALGSAYTVNASLPRTPQAKVYQQIIADLKDAQTLLNANYLDPTLLNITGEKVRPTKWAAMALLARAYLYTNDWPDAEAEADSVIANTGLFNLSPLNGAFLMNSTEAIWQLQPVGTDVQSNTGYGIFFILPPGGPNTFPNEVYLSSTEVNSFEINDQRRGSWVDSVIVAGATYYYPYKYKIGAVATTTQEYLMMLRLGEQYLIRAEARAEQNNIVGAQADLDSIRARAGLPATTAGDMNSLLMAIAHERQVELFTEWGDRWLNLKRNGTIDAIMTVAAPQKSGLWSPFKALYPVPETELKTDPNLSQNTGY